MSIPEDVDIFTFFCLSAALLRPNRLEFAADPLTGSEGAVRVFGSERRSTIYEGEVFEADGGFVVRKAEKGRGLTGVVVTFKTKDGNERNVTFQLGDGAYPSVISGVAHPYPAVLTAAHTPAPKPEPVPGLIQPPKKPGK